MTDASQEGSAALSFGAVHMRPKLLYEALAVALIVGSRDSEAISHARGPGIWQAGRRRRLRRRPSTMLR